MVTPTKAVYQWKVQEDSSCSVLRLDISAGLQYRLESQIIGLWCQRRNGRASKREQEQAGREQASFLHVLYTGCKEQPKIKVDLPTSKDGLKVSLSTQGSGGAFFPNTWKAETGGSL